MRVISGFLGAILVALALQVITPPNAKLTSMNDPYSVLGTRLVWNTGFVIAAIGVGFLVGCLLSAAVSDSMKRRSRAASTPE